MNNVIYTHHAEQRMLERRVSPQMIMDTIIKGETRLLENNKFKVTYKKTVVVYKRDSGVIVIITYWQ